MDSCNRFEIMIFETAEEYLAKKAKSESDRRIRLFKHREEVEEKDACEGCGEIDDRTEYEKEEVGAEECNEWVEYGLFLCYECQADVEADRYM